MLRGLIVSVLFFVGVVGAIAVAPYVQSTENAAVSFWAHASDQRDGTAVMLLRFVDATPITDTAKGLPVNWVHWDALPSELRPPQTRDVTHQVVRITPTVELRLVLWPDGALQANALTGNASTVSYNDIPRPLVMRFLPRNTDTDSEVDYTPVAVSDQWMASGTWMSTTSPPLGAPARAVRIHETPSLLLLEARKFVMERSDEHLDSLAFYGSRGSCLLLDCRGGSHGRLPMILSDGLYHAINVTYSFERVTPFVALPVIRLHAPPGYSFSNDGAINGWESPVAVALSRA